MSLRLIHSDDHSRRVPSAAPKSPMELYALSVSANAELLHGVSSGDDGLTVAALRRLLAIGCLCQMAADELEGSR